MATVTFRATKKALSMQQFADSVKTCIRAYFYDYAGIMPGLVRQKLSEMYDVSTDDSELFKAFVVLVETGFLKVEITHDPKGNYFYFSVGK